MGRFNNAGIAGEGSREGYEKSEDVEKYSQQLLRSEFKEWDDILRTNVTSHYVRLISTLACWICSALQTWAELILVHRCLLPTPLEERWRQHQRLHIADHQHHLHFRSIEGIVRRSVRLRLKQGLYGPGMSPYLRPSWKPRADRKDDKSHGERVSTPQDPSQPDCCK